jgi:hypothetical protein
MPAFSLSIRRCATNEAGCWAGFTFSGGWAEIAKVKLVADALRFGALAVTSGISVFRVTIETPYDFGDMDF